MNINNNADQTDPELSGRSDSFDSIATEQNQFDSLHPEEYTGESNNHKEQSVNKENNKPKDAKETNFWHRFFFLKNISPFYKGTIHKNQDEQMTQNNEGHNESNKATNDKLKKSQGNGDSDSFKKISFIKSIDSFIKINSQKTPEHSKKIDSFEKSSSLKNNDALEIEGKESENNSSSNNIHDLHDSLHQKKSLSNQKIDIRDLFKHAAHYELLEKKINTEAQHAEYEREVATLTYKFISSSENYDNNKALLELLTNSIKNDSNLDAFIEFKGQKSKNTGEYIYGPDERYYIYSNHDYDHDDLAAFDVLAQLSTQRNKFEEIEKEAKIKKLLEDHKILDTSAQGNELNEKNNSSKMLNLFLDGADLETQNKISSMLEEMQIESIKEIFENGNINIVHELDNQMINLIISRLKLITKVKENKEITDSEELECRLILGEYTSSSLLKIFIDTANNFKQIQNIAFIESEKLQAKEDNKTHLDLNTQVILEIKDQNLFKDNSKAVDWLKNSKNIINNATEKLSNIFNFKNIHFDFNRVLYKNVINIESDFLYRQNVEILDQETKPLVAIAPYIEYSERQTFLAPQILKIIAIEPNFAENFTFRILAPKVDVNLNNKFDSLKKINEPYIYKKVIIKEHNIKQDNVAKPQSINLLEKATHNAHNYIENTAELINLKNNVLDYALSALKNINYSFEASNLDIKSSIKQYTIKQYTKEASQSVISIDKDVTNTKKIYDLNIKTQEPHSYVLSIKNQLNNKNTDRDLLQYSKSLYENKYIETSQTSSLKNTPHKQNYIDYVSKYHQEKNNIPNTEQQKHKTSNLKSYFKANEGIFSTNTNKTDAFIEIKSNWSKGKGYEYRKKRKILDFSTYKVPCN